MLTQRTMALARTLPPMQIFLSFLHALGSTYHAVQRGEEARSALEEAEAVAEALDLGPLLAIALSQLCMHCAVAEEWEAAYRYAVKAIAVRKSHDVALNTVAFYSQYETGALVRAGDERLARAEVQRLGERLGPNRRFRLPYLRSLAVLAAWEGHREQAIGHLRDATQIAESCTRSLGTWKSTSLQPRKTGVPASEPGLSRGVPSGPMSPLLKPATPPYLHALRATNSNARQAPCEKPKSMVRSSGIPACATCASTLAMAASPDERPGSFLARGA